VIPETSFWLDRQLAQFAQLPVDVDKLLAKQLSEFDAAWQRFRDRYPRKAQSIRSRIEQLSLAARKRKVVRL